IGPLSATKGIFVLIWFFLLLSPASCSAIIDENKITIFSYRIYENSFRVFLTEEPEFSPILSAQEVSLPLTEGENNKQLENMSFFLILAAGIIAGFNPCFLAVMATFASVTPTENRERNDMLKITLGFSAGIFTMYMLAGIGILGVVSFLPEIRNDFTAISILIIILLGFWHIYDAYWLKKHAKTTFKTPEALKNFMGKMGEKNLLLFPFLSGGMYSLVKAPCVGAIYLSLLSILATKTDLVKGTAYMGVYNFGLLLPVVALGLLLAFGLSPKKVTEFRENWRVEVRLVTGFILISVALLMQFKMI
ncbi:MAG TPA: cytochrome c biogenesis CcdA family protein, partial [Methanosarcina sp.]|nr:cytochrome c biogenesis CcdA family protein [Methanosarcina sp.]